MTRKTQILIEFDVRAIGFRYPVVHEDRSRIRVPISAGYSRADLSTAVVAIRQAARTLNIIPIDTRRIS